jgi:hypothetical protein
MGQRSQAAHVLAALRQYRLQLGDGGQYRRRHRCHGTAYGCTAAPEHGGA